ncbi:hypothetical protein G647_08030 [Cladophialophora carrionii CBS 160.54]|uniref:Uncharacterized protein n=1 Tax=Cladophialophora carrionii CBS 160.54 TaxID=1279043 RepID=V9D5V7_9EURO|nr:uncharacterized protein G647_08030 [Cladophialophora carrionii CBS 160.54]ETI21683.1 hypothetical protein G647_08030 [Cladophialophora carrionii CBS 160.54]
MAKSVLVSPFRYLANLVASPKSSASTDSSHLDPSLRQDPSPSTKRKADQEEQFGRQPKKHAIRTGHGTPDPYEDDNDNHSASSPDLPMKRTRIEAGLDRSLMPPPATPHGKMKNFPIQRISPSTRRDSQGWIRDDDSTSFVSTAVTRKKPDLVDNDLMEEARRHAAAITLPPNSGIWSQTERELFFHLAYRGFEPLLPQNWMLDFDTLPISVFAHEDSLDPALIQNVRDNQFRAGHALRRLFEAGQDARDRSHVSPGVRRERVLEKSVKRYLYWALTDVGLRPRSKTQYIPVHVVAARRTGHSTLQTLEEVATKLQKLSERHQRAQNVHPSVETRGMNSADADETRVADDDPSTPTLIGLVIISAVLVVVTLSPFAPPAPECTHGEIASPAPSGPSTHGGTSFNPDRLRIIAELDFSQKDQDVWNALGVAIAAMEIRREALKVNRGFTNDDMSAMDWDGMSTPGSKFEDDMGEVSTLSRLQLDDDPDL